MSQPIQQVIATARQQALGGQLGRALSTLQSVYGQRPSLFGRDTFENIRESHRLMLDYLVRGFQDAEREPLYHRLLEKTYGLTADLEAAWRCKNLGLYATAFHRANHLNLSPAFLQEVLERFVGDAAMLSLEPEATRQGKQKELYERHQTFMDRLFCALFVAVQWPESLARELEHIVLLPTIDQRDALLMVAGISLSAVSLFDYQKTVLLAHVYREAAEPALRQRALVGLLFSLSSHALYAERLQPLLDELLGLPRFATDLTDMQKQVFYCLEAEEAHKVIERDIMPGIVNNSNLRITRLGIEEVESDPMEEILHPDAEDKAMEEVERGMEKMRQMMQAGSDIYFGGFSQMKRFPFFGVLSNWFTPFYIEHPALADQLPQLQQDGNFLNFFLEQGSFCESDKYSMALALSRVYDRLPASMREMMAAAAPYSGEERSGNAPTDTLVRRLYLQDLYRFFRLHPNRTDVGNPFEVQKDEAAMRAFFLVSPLFRGEQYNKVKLSVARFLYAKHKYDELGALLDTFSMATAEYYVMLGQTLLHQSGTAEAAEAFAEALRLEVAAEQPQLRQRGLRGRATCLMRLRRYTEAAQCFQQLLDVRPQDVSAAVSRSIALLECDNVDEAVGLLSKFHYHHPDNHNVRRVLAWSLLLQGKHEQAERHYAAILSAQPAGADWLNAGYSAWAGGRLQEAAGRFAAYIKEQQPDDDAACLADAFRNDERLMSRLAFSAFDQQLMVEAVCQR